MHGGRPTSPLSVNPVVAQSKPVLLNHSVAEPEIGDTPGMVHDVRSETQTGNRRSS